jgi:hydroxymethylpyrimidine kinase/phosphomethylpyrimidine kinase/thiamine-phosphate diphosphorylase
MSHPLVWCVGGLDSSGGAGLTRDAITLADIGVKAAMITTQVAIQSNTHSYSQHALNASAINSQWQTLAYEQSPCAIKIGAIADDIQGLLLCARMSLLHDSANNGEGDLPVSPYDTVTHRNTPLIIWDPVLHTSSGGKLSDIHEDTIAALLTNVHVITPNIDELGVLSGKSIHSHASLLQAATSLSNTYRIAVLVKGGHATWHDNAVDILVCGTQQRMFTQHRNGHNTLRGTGCMQASALAGFMAKGYNLEDAATLANAYIKKVRTTVTTSQNEIAHAVPVGMPCKAEHFPSVTFENDSVLFRDITTTNTKAPLAFPALKHSQLGIYPVVDSAKWVARLTKAGVKIIQLRLKGTPLTARRAEIKQAINHVAGTHTQLFINDDWQQAIALGAYGVHLGQEDLATSDLNAIASAGLRLGISTHGFCELQRIKALNPSYIALGHIFPTQTKVMPSLPQGLDNLRRYVQLCGDTPSVAIGGIDVSRAKPVSETGVSAIAVVSAITQSSAPEAALHRLAQEACYA